MVASPRLRERSFRVGEVITPMPGHPAEKVLEDAFVTVGTNYRVMSMADKDRRPIFSTDDVPKDKRKRVRLALRPRGWEFTKQVNAQLKRPTIQWPEEVEAGLLSTLALL